MADSNHDSAKITVSPPPLRNRISCPSSARQNRRATSNPQPTTKISTLPPLSSLPPIHPSPNSKDRSIYFSNQAQTAGQGPGEHGGEGTIRLHREGSQAARQHPP